MPREYDHRPARLLKLLRELRDMGVMPLEVAIDGIHLVLAPPAPAAQPATERGPTEPIAVEPRPPSHRQRAREDLRRRIEGRS